MSALRQSDQPERRGALRHPVVMQGILSTEGGGACDVTLTDISDRGCRIVRPAGLAGGTAVSLSFGGFAPVATQVAWTTADAAGLRFEAPVHPALIRQVVAAAKGRRRPAGGLHAALVRREERERLWHLRRPVSLRVGGTAVEGVLCDLSIGGCRVVSESEPPAGTTLQLMLENRRALAGEVRWCEGGAIGVAFAEPLGPEAVRAIAHGG